MEATKTITDESTIADRKFRHLCDSMEWNPNFRRRLRDVSNAYNIELDKTQTTK